MRPLGHSPDGSFTKLELSWRGISLRVETASEGKEWVCRVTPLAGQLRPATLVVSGSAPWNLGGWCQPSGDGIDLCWSGGAIQVRVIGEPADADNAAWNNPALGAALTGETWVVAGELTLEEARTLLEQKAIAHSGLKVRFGPMADAFDGMQMCLSWNTIFDPIHKRVITPVSRIWNTGNGGWILFCWDAFFASWIASTFDAALAKENAIAILDEVTEDGFVPNFASATGVRSRDRSQPPVGAICCRAVADASGDGDFLDRTYAKLLRWNRWWPENRQVKGGLAWGSNPYTPTNGNFWETEGVGQRFGASLESGLDNSPMYDDVPFDPDTHTLRMADVGLTALYAADCEALASIASKRGYGGDADDLEARRKKALNELEGLWNADMGIFCNRRTDTGEFCRRLSPTNFYALLAGAATAEQAREMAERHLLNPDEFWGAYAMPSISRSDPAFADNHYWRGRIWAPMNFLVYLGLCRYPSLADARKQFAEKSISLFLGEWLSEGHVHENYNADTGDGDDVSSSDAFYHWGGLLALIGLMEHGLVPKPTWD